MIIADEGFWYGIGAFETLLIHRGLPAYLPEHLARLNRALRVLEIPRNVGIETITTYLDAHSIEEGFLKIGVSSENTEIIIGPPRYRAPQYETGFSTGLSPLMRNDSSPLTYIKSLAYADNLLAKRRAMAEGIDEPVFSNSKGELCEAASSNLFFVNGRRIFTPPQSCGLLDGVVRARVLALTDAEERVIRPEEVGDFDEMFLTNSIVGIMPVRSFGEKIFEHRKVTDDVAHLYREDLKKNLYRD